MRYLTSKSPGAGGSIAKRKITERSCPRLVSRRTLVRNSAPSLDIPIEDFRGFYRFREVNSGRVFRLDYANFRIVTNQSLIGQTTIRYTESRTAQHRTAQHSTAQHSTRQHSTRQHSTAQHCTGQHSTAQHRTAQHRTGQLSTAQHSTAQSSTTDCTVEESSCDSLHGLLIFLFTKTSRPAVGPTQPSIQ